MATDDIPARPTRATLGEIATTQDGMDITRYTGGQLLYPTDEVLRQRGSGLDLTIYKQVLSNPKCYSTFRDLRLAVTGAEWDVEPASQRRVDIKAADYVRTHLRNIGFDRACNLMMFAAWYGYGVAEWRFDIRDGLIALTGGKVRDRRRFRFAPDGSLRLLTRSHMAEGVPLDPGRFWVSSFGADHDDEPYGTGLGHYCYWPDQFQRQGMARWVTFLDRFAQPVAIGEYDSKLDDAAGTERRKLLSALRAIRTDSGIALPQGMAIKLLEAARSGTPDYQTLHDAMNAVIAQVVIGQTMTSEDGSSRSQAEVHESGFQRIVKAYADLQCEQLTQGIVRNLVRWNFAGADVPRVYRKLEPPADLDKQAERQERISRLGYRPTIGEIIKIYGGEWEPVPGGAPPADPANRATSPATSADVAFADSAPKHRCSDHPHAHDFADGEAPPPSIAETLADKLAQEAEPAWREIIDVIEARVQAATSLPALRDELLAMWPRLPRERLSAAMGAALAAADVIGRLDVIADDEATRDG